MPSYGNKWVRKILSEATQSGLCLLNIEYDYCSVSFDTCGGPHDFTYVFVMKYILR